MNITERFLNYTKFDTQSSEESETVPSTSKQLIFARYLKDELEEVGLQDVSLDDKG
jgi:tripeptide aminopeptidase